MDVFNCIVIGIMIIFLLLIACTYFIVKLNSEQRRYESLIFMLNEIIEKHKIKHEDDLP